MSHSALGILYSAFCIFAFCLLPYNCITVWQYYICYCAVATFAAALMRLGRPRKGERERARRIPMTLGMQEQHRQQLALHYARGYASLLCRDLVSTSRQIMRKLNDNLKMKLFKLRHRELLSNVKCLSLSCSSLSWCTYSEISARILNCLLFHV